MALEPLSAVEGRTLAAAGHHQYVSSCYTLISIHTHTHIYIYTRVLYNDAAFNVQRRATIISPINHIFYDRFDVSSMQISIKLYFFALLPSTGTNRE